MSSSVRWILVAIVAALCTAIWYFFFTPERTITNFPSQGTDIIAFGDSLIYGTGATEGHDFVSLLSAQIGAPIVNLGVPGNTTADGLARLSDLDAYHPKVVILLLGGNDHLKRVPKETTFKNLSNIIESIQARGAIVLLLGVKGSLFGDQFASEFETLRKRYHTALVSNVLDGLFGTAEYMADSVHPNDAGYQIIANRVHAAIVPLLQ
jgi:acyl-CoA thioesterase I